jgi:hypothetical protein
MSAAFVKYLTPPMARQESSLEDFEDHRDNYDNFRLVVP